MEIVAPNRASRYIGTVILASLVVALWLSATSRDAVLRALVTIPLVVAAARSLRVGVEVTDETVTYRGYLFSRRVARERVRRVSDFPCLVWESRSGRVRSSPMLCFVQSNRFPARPVNANLMKDLRRILRPPRGASDDVPASPGPAG